MAITGQDFTIYQGDKRSIAFTIYDDATPPAVVDITSATFVWVLCKVTTEVPTLTKIGPGAGDPITLTDPTHGVLSVPLVEADTNTLQGDWKHQLQMMLGSETKIVAEGTITVLPSSIEHT